MPGTRVPGQLSGQPAYPQRTQSGPYQGRQRDRVQAFQGRADVCQERELRGQMVMQGEVVRRSRPAREDFSYARGIEFWRGGSTRRSAADSNWQQSGTGGRFWALGRQLAILPLKRSVRDCAVYEQVRICDQPNFRGAKGSPELWGRREILIAVMERDRRCSHPRCQWGLRLSRCCTVCLAFRLVFQAIDMVVLIR